MDEDPLPPYDRGLENLRDVYAGDVVTLPEGTMAFNDVMVQTLFDQVWRRRILDVRTRRLLLMGVIAATVRPTRGRSRPGPQSSAAN
jgi:hypothetical protein